MRTVLIPGSYDPITLGHLEVIRRATALFDRVVVAVMDNDAKTYRFTREQRLELAFLLLAYACAKDHHASLAALRFLLHLHYSHANPLHGDGVELHHRRHG